MPIDKIDFAVSCPATATDEIDLQLTKTGDQARNWMAIFQNYRPKTTLKQAFAHSRVSGTKLKALFYLDEVVKKMGGENLYLIHNFKNVTWDRSNGMNLYYHQRSPVNMEKLT